MRIELGMRAAETPAGDRDRGPRAATIVGLPELRTPRDRRGRESGLQYRYCCLLVM